MRKLLILLAAMFLCGCSAGQSFETVRDEWPCCAPEDAPYVIDFTAPEGAILKSGTDSVRVYEAPGGEYSVTAKILVSDGMDAAVYALCGFVQTRLDLDGARECRLAWQEDDEICRARIRREGEYFYCLIFRLNKGLCGKYNSMINELFSSYSLIERPK